MKKDMKKDLGQEQEFQNSWEKPERALTAFSVLTRALAENVYAVSGEGNLDLYDIIEAHVLFFPCPQCSGGEVTLYPSGLYECDTCNWIKEPKGYQE